MRRSIAGAVAILSVVSVGCPGWKKAAPATTPSSPPPAVVPAAPPPPPPPPPGERETAEAMSALRAGDLVLAATWLDQVLALGSRAPSREEALFTLAVIEALPSNPARDVVRARVLLREVIASGGSPSRSEASGLILSFLAQEEELTRSISELKLQIESSRSESEDLKATLAQRESELKKIKEILLGKSPAG
jgi:hypothetical protein